MFIICEYGACLLAALIGGTFLFTAGAMCVMFMEAGRMAWRKWPGLSQSANWLMGRWADEVREP